MEGKDDIISDILINFTTASIDDTRSRLMAANIDPRVVEMVHKPPVVVETEWLFMYGAATSMIILLMLVVIYKCL